MIDDSRHPGIPVRAWLTARSKVRPRKPMALLLSGLTLIAAVAPAAADPAGDGKTKSSKNVLEQLSEMLEEGLKANKATLTSLWGNGKAKASLPGAAATSNDPKQVIRSTKGGVLKRNSQ
jgi:hypothetical protein